MLYLAGSCMVVKRKCHISQITHTMNMSTTTKSANKVLTKIMYFTMLFYNKVNFKYSLFLLFSNKMLVFKAGSHKMLVRIANREDLDQTASSEAVLSLSALLV